LGGFGFGVVCLFGGGGGGGGGGLCPQKVWNAWRAGGNEERRKELATAITGGVQMPTKRGGSNLIAANEGKEK